MTTAAYLDMVNGDPLPELERWREDVEDALAVTGTHAFEHAVAELRREDGLRLFRVIAANQPIGVIVLQIREFPLTRILNIWLVAGEGVVKREDALTEELVRVARTVDCDRIWGIGRDGWVRPGLRTGWRMVTRLMEYIL